MKAVKMTVKKRIYNEHLTLPTVLLKKKAEGREKSSEQQQKV